MSLYVDKAQRAVVITQNIGAGNFFYAKCIISIPWTFQSALSLLYQSYLAKEEREAVVESSLIILEFVGNNFNLS